MVKEMRLMLQSAVAVKRVTARGQRGRDLIRVGLNIDPPTEEVFDRPFSVGKRAEPRSLFELWRRGFASAPIVIIVQDTRRIGHVWTCPTRLAPGGTPCLL